MTVAASPRLALLLLSLGACSGADARRRVVDHRGHRQQRHHQRRAAPTTGADTSTSEVGSDASSTGGPSELPPPECGSLDRLRPALRRPRGRPGQLRQVRRELRHPPREPRRASPAPARRQLRSRLGRLRRRRRERLREPRGAVCVPAVQAGRPRACNLLDDNCDAQCDEGGVPGCRQPVHRAQQPDPRPLLYIGPRRGLLGRLHARVPQLLLHVHAAAAGPGPASTAASRATAAASTPPAPPARAPARSRASSATSAPNPPAARSRSTASTARATTSTRPATPSATTRWRCTATSSRPRSASSGRRRSDQRKHSWLICSLEPALATHSRAPAGKRTPSQRASSAA
jgi:hypothetical protein